MIFTYLILVASDYTPVTRTLTFPRGQTTSTISIVSTQDEVQEGPEQFTATLTNPTSGLQIGSSDTATVTIRDDDGKIVGIMCSMCGKSNIFLLLQ